jgi:tetratricopeptide (TPR) repeat protein
MTDLMHAAGHSFRTLATAVNADPGYLNKVANGGRPTPGPSLVAALDKSLHADGELVSLAEQEHAPVPRAAAQPLGDSDAAATRATLQHLVALDTLNGSAGLSPLAVRSFRSAADRIAVVGGTADVRSAIADLGAAAAWITSDDVRRDQSRAIALEALSLADLAGDDRLHQFLLSHLSMVSEHAGRYADALAYAEQIRAENPDNPRVQAMVEIRRARALSGLGAHDDAVNAWDLAEHLLTASPSVDDGLTYWIHDSEMAIHKAVILTRAGSRDAVDWAHRGVEWLPDDQGRDLVLFRAMLLHDAVSAHAWREVPGIVDDLLRFAGPAPSARIPEVLGQVLTLVEQTRAPRPVRDAVRAARAAFLVEGES